jgi:hypothetical protein
MALAPGTQLGPYEVPTPIGTLGDRTRAIRWSRSALARGYSQP